jgi:hypothetical protein
MYVYKYCVQLLNRVLRLPVDKLVAALSPHFFQIEEDEDDGILRPWVDFRNPKRP